MEIKNIIFDWDGTLGMTLHLWLAGYRESLEEQGHTIPDSIIARDFFYEHDKGQLKYPDVDFVKLVDNTRAYVFSHLDDLELYEGTKDTVITLYEQGIKLALVSSSSRKLLEKGLSLHGLDKYFSSIISGDDITKHKPDPEAFNQTFAAIDALPEETLIIGDAKTDIMLPHTEGGQGSSHRTMFTNIDTLYKRESSLVSRLEVLYSYQDRY